MRSMLRFGALLVGLLLGGASSLGAQPRAPVIPFPAQWYTSNTAGALAASGVVSTTPTCLLDLVAINTSAAKKFLQLYDSATVPADGAVPTVSIYCEATGNCGWNTEGIGICFATGLSWAGSSTAATKTGAAADMIVYILHRNP